MEKPVGLHGSRLRPIPGETFSIFEIDNIKNEAILRDVLQKWKVDCRNDGLVPMRFAIVLFHLSKVLRLPAPRKKVMPGRMKCCTCHAKLRLPREIHLCRCQRF